MILGDYNQLKVLRETDIAYLLTDDHEEVFLHKKEALKPYEPGEVVDVFIYADNVGRKTASTKEAMVSISKAAFLEVVSVNPTYGVFLHYGLVKDLLLSKDDLPLLLDEWPLVGDKLFVSMKEKKSHLFAKIIGRKQIKDYLVPVNTLHESDFTDSNVAFLTEDGLVCTTFDGNIIFVHYNNTRRKYRLGEAVQPKILKQNDNLEYTGTLIEQKELMMGKDSQIIIDYLTNHHGVMRFTDKSTPEDISYAFQMSKSAFKRALGTLYKSGVVELQPDKTVLKNL